MVDFAGRPGISPATAALIASGRLGPGGLALDVGCGDGTDAVGLAEHGIGVVGLDPDAAALALARRRARGAGVEASTWFLRGRVERVPDLFFPGTFDAVVDVLTYNNVTGGNDPDARQAKEDEYAHAVRHALRRGGILALQWRIPAKDRAPDALMCHLPEAFASSFALLGPPVATHLPETHARPRRPAHADVGLACLRRR